ncbi:MAG: DNA polymerase III subunit delta [Bacteroidetes bacterium]|nr:DNA polymerase III subunit delta [Bacteroidota bacterium]
MAKTTRKGSRASGSPFKKTADAFRRGEFAPVYFVYGTESFLADELQRILIATALQPHEKDFNLDIVYGADVDAGQVLALCSSYPVMAMRRVVIVRDFEKVKQAQQLVAFAEKPNPSAVVMFVCRGRPSMNTNPYRAMKKAAADVELKSLYDNEIPAWIAERAREEGMQIEGRASQMLADYVGTDLQSIVGELDKLSTFVGDRKEITVDDVIKGSGQTREINVFELQKAVGTGDYPNAAFIAEQLLQQASNAQGEAIRAISILTSYFVKLRLLTNCQSKGVPRAAMAERIGVNPYFMQDYLGSLRYYGSRSIENALSALLAADFELKGGTMLDSNLIVSLMLRRIIPAEITV